MSAIELFKKVYLLIVCVLITAHVQAQRAPASLDKHVKIPAKEMNIISLGDLITAQTGFILSFNAQKIVAMQQLQLKHSSYSVRQLLTMIREATNSEYTIYQEHVIFHKIKNVTSQTSTAKQLAAHLTITDQKQQQYTNTSVRHKVSNISGNSMSHHNKALSIQADADQLSILKDHANIEGAVLRTRSSEGKNNTTQDTANNSLTTYNTSGSTAETPDIDKDRPSYILSYIPTVNIVYPFAKPAAPILLVSSPVQQHKQPREYKKPGLFQPFAQPGFAADEVLYAHLQAKAGITLAYGIVSWSTNFSVSGFRYGVGSSYPLKNGWLIQLEATTGKLSKEALVRANIDTATVKYPLRTDSRLQRLSLFAQKSMTQHLSVYAGPVYNRLKSTYQIWGTSTSPASIEQSLVASEKDYSTIKPPYTLSDSPPTAKENIKTWIGLQIAFSYRF